MSIRVTVDVTNPGQFFACCGLLELADRLWPGAEGWFEASAFRIRTDGDLPTVITALAGAPLDPLDPEDNTASPIRIGAPFRPLGDRQEKSYLPLRFLGVMVMSYLGNVAERSRRAL